VAWRQKRPTAEEVMRWKSTCGITFVLTSSMTLLTSPAWIALSLLTASRVSMDSWRIS